MKWTDKKGKAGVRKAEERCWGTTRHDGAARSLSLRVLGKVDGVRLYSNLLCRKLREGLTLMV